jgi:hypothetical protein
MIARYKYHKIIGKGGLGTVYQVSIDKADEFYALKVMKKSEII